MQYNSPTQRAHPQVMPGPASRVRNPAVRSRFVPPSLFRMYRPVVLLFAWACLLAPFCARAQQGPTALLLGLRYEEPIPAPLPYYILPADSLVRPVYRTLLIVRDVNGRFEIVADRGGLVVPRRSDLWMVNTKRSVYNAWVEDFLTSAPLRRHADAAGIQAYNGEFCQGHRVQIIHFAGPSYLGVEQRTAGYCEDAAHPWFTNELAVIPIDSTTHSGLSIGQVVGRPGQDALTRGVRGYLSALRSAREREIYFSEPDEANWTVVRQTGRWRLRGRLESAEVASPQHADFWLDLKPPASLVGYDELSIPWDRIRAAVPDAVDAVSSPTRDFVVILQPGRVSIHPMHPDGIGPSSLTMDVAASASVVMAQWTSTNANSWIQALRNSGASMPVGWQAREE